MSGICTLTSKKKKTFIREKKFFEHYGFKVVDTIGDYELLALKFDDSETPRFNDNARLMKIDNQEFTIYYCNGCPYVEYEVKELTEYSKNNNIKINFIKIDSLEKAKNAPDVFSNWANFYKGEFISNTIMIVKVIAIILIILIYMKMELNLFILIWYDFNRKLKRYYFNKLDEHFNILNIMEIVIIVWF